jgi:hypothetical protein
MEEESLIPKRNKINKAIKFEASVLVLMMGGE